MKKTLKRLFACVLSAALVLALAAGCDPTEDVNSSSGDVSSAAQETLTVYTSPDFPPYEYVEGTNYVGIDMELAKAIGEKLGKKVNIVPCDFDGIVTAISTKQADLAISGITITPDRQKEVDFSDPYTVSVQYLILRSDSSISCMEDLAAKKVGVARGYTGQGVMDAETNLVEKDDGSKADGVLKGKKTTINIYDTAMDASQDLANKNIDAVVMDALVAQSIAALNNKLKAIPLKYKNSDIPEEKFGVIVPKGDPNGILETINAVIAELKENGKLDEWGNTYANKKAED